MKDLIYKTMLELTLWGLIVGILSSFVKRVKTVREFIENAIASTLVVIPTGFLLEHYEVEVWIKYAIVSGVSAFGICLFNGISKLLKEFEENPEKIIKKLKGKK